MQRQVFEKMFGIKRPAYAWTIDKFPVTDGFQAEPHGTVLQGPANVTDDLLARLEAGEGEAFKMFDDDDICYFEGRILIPGDTGEDDPSGDVHDAPMWDLGEAYGCVRIVYPITVFTISNTNVSPESGVYNLGDFTTREDAEAWVRDVVTFTRHDEMTAGQITVTETTRDLNEGEYWVISLDIENTYELYADVTTHLRNAVIPAAPWNEETQEWEDWKQANLIDWSGVGNEDGDSWYDITVTDCTNPKYIGREFNWGY